MTIGNKIKQLRLEKGLSQEKLAQQLNVSRSAIAKWEVDGGIPELDNLLQLSSLFNVSLDELVGHERSQPESKLHEFRDGRYVIEVGGLWDDSIYGVYIVNEDSDFLYYGQSLKKGEIVYGMVNKKHIVALSSLKEKKIAHPIFKEIQRTDFIGKPVQITLVKREGLIKGFFDFRDDDYRKVILQSIESDKLVLEFGKSLKLDNVMCIELY